LLNKDREQNDRDFACFVPFGDQYHSAWADISDTTRALILDGLPCETSQCFLSLHHIAAES